MKGVILIPGCVLCPTFQVKYNGDNQSWRKELLTFFIDNDIEVIQMPCPEVMFKGYTYGLQRAPHSVKFYENQQGFKEHCASLANSIVDQIKGLRSTGCHVIALLGIENSPTCAVNRIFTFGIGTEKRQGILIEAIDRQLRENGMEVPILGINKRKKTQRDIIDLIVSM